MPLFSVDAFLAQFRYNPKAPLLFQDGFFVYFFSLFISLYYAFRNVKNGRAWLLCLFSLYFFYKASGWFVGLVLLSAVLDYAVSNLIFHAKTKSRKKALLTLSVLFNLGMLFCFKYTDFFITLSNEVFTSDFKLWHLALPVGISFYTFENLSYTIDVYRGEFIPERNFLNYLLFLSFFPKLIMGPIVRARDFIPQLHQPYSVSAEDFSHGFYLIVSGLFKKLVISDYITTNLVNYVFDGPSMHTGLECLLAVYGYAVVIYCDFSGYSDVAIGMARWLGIRIPPNFASPYQSKSITEFWGRWHISLSSWLKDYLYILSFGGNRRSTIGSAVLSVLFFGGAVAACGFQGFQNGVWWPAFALLLLIFVLIVPALFAKERKRSLATSLNQMNTMLLGGAWHGASWNFILWGAMHGVALALHKIWMQLTGKPLKTAHDKRWYKLITGLVTFHFVCFCWIFFKAGSFELAGQMIHQILHDFSFSVWRPLYANYHTVIWMILLGMVLHLIPEAVPPKVSQRMQRLPMPAYVALFIAFIFVYAAYKSAVPVLPIYLQF